MHGATPPLPHTSSWQAIYFSTEKTLSFYFTYEIILNAELTGTEGGRKQTPISSSAHSYKYVSWTIR
jgi:hypothetical protein